MGRFPAGKIRLWIGQPVNAPFVTPPLSLRVTLFLCIVSVTATLIYAVATQLRLGSSMAAAEMIFIAIVHFVLPVLIAHSVSVNRWFSRPLIVLYSLATGFQLAGWVSNQSWPSTDKLAAIAGILAWLIAILIWLFATSKIRVYYALISGSGLPDDVDRPVEELLGPGRLEIRFTRFFQGLAPYIERAIVALIIVAVLLAWASMSIDWL